MPIVKIWSADQTIKKIVAADCLSDVITQACQKGICGSENVKVRLSIVARPCMSQQIPMYCTQPSYMAHSSGGSF